MAVAHPNVYVPQAHLGLGPFDLRSKHKRRSKRKSKGKTRKSKKKKAKGDKNKGGGLRALGYVWVCFLAQFVQWQMGLNEKAKGLA